MIKIKVRFRNRGKDTYRELGSAIKRIDSRTQAYREANAAIINKEDVLLSIEFKKIVRRKR